MDPLTITLTLTGVGLLGRLLVALTFSLFLMSVLYGAFCFCWFVYGYYLRSFSKR